MRILFVSRAFPPTLGGIEKQNSDLSIWLEKHMTVEVIANRRGKHFLPFFLPWALLRILFSLSRFDVLLLGDGVLAPLGYLAKCFFSKKAVLSIVHGLDLIYSRKKTLLGSLYGVVNLPALKGLDALICVSQETKALAITLGVAPERTFVIPNGVDPEDVRAIHTREELSQFLGEDVGGKKIILRIGRFVRHKGVAWFIQNVVPLLPPDTLFIAAGGMAKRATPGDENIFPECQKLIQELHLEKQVKLFINVSWETIRLLLNTADVAVAPNIRVPGSMEGFGISVIEASLCRLPVVVSRLEGLQEAVQEGENGFFVESGDTRGFAQKIKELLSDDAARKTFGEKSARYSEEHFHWSVISLKYMEVINTVAKKVEDEE